MKMIGRWTTLVAAFCLVGSVARADTLVLDESTGADYDAVGDGWLFAHVGPPIPPFPAPDGVGDAGNQALAISFIDGVLALRAMAEFPLSALAGLTPEDIVSATLTVTIDDVFSTLGPGSTLDGTAADPFEAWKYEGDGIVNVSDFAPPDATLLESVVTGEITDATLANTGAQSFDIDVTEELKLAISEAHVAFGVQLTTVDHPTGTSFDDLGVPGAAFPYITVEHDGTLATTTSTTVPTSTTSTVPETTTSTSLAPATTTSTSVAPATTTSTSVAPASTTSTSIAPATTTSTTVTPPSTTSTTLPQVCGSDPAIASIACRVDELGEVIAANQEALGAAFGKIQKNLPKIEKLLADAAAALEDGNEKKARAALRKLGGRYRTIGRPLRSKTGRVNIPAELRNSLLDLIDDLRSDTKSLMQSL